MGKVAKFAGISIFIGPADLDEQDWLRSRSDSPLLDFPEIQAKPVNDWASAFRKAEKVQLGQEQQLVVIQRTVQLKRQRKDNI